MKTTTLTICSRCLLAGLNLLFSVLDSQGQCNFQITAEVGTTQQFPCNEVSVTSTGDAFSGNGCLSGPYMVGFWFEGSFTFTFTNPVAQVSLNFEDISKINNPNLSSTITLEVNGTPTPFPGVGMPISCNPLHAVLGPSGSLQCPPCPNGANSCIAGCVNININGVISSITIRNVGMSGFASGSIFSIYFCGLSAGTLQDTPITICENELAIFSPATEVNLESGTMLQYVLYEDPNNPIGSILAIGNSPSFPFFPGSMNTNTTYYIAAIAGETLNGNVNLQGNCVAFSNPIPVVWLPLPAVVFTVDDNELCKNECAVFTATISGTAPFSLTYTTSLGGLPITETYNDPVNQIEVCPPFNANLSSLGIQAIRVSDSFCICQ